MTTTTCWDIQKLVAYLTVKGQDLIIMQTHQRNHYLVPKLIVENTSMLKWYIAIAYAVHMDWSREQNENLLFTNQNYYGKNSTKRAHWSWWCISTHILSRYFLLDQVCKMGKIIIYQDNKKQFYLKQMVRDVVPRKNPDTLQHAIFHSDQEGMF